MKCIGRSADAVNREQGVATVEWRIIGLNFLYAVFGVLLMYVSYRAIDALTPAGQRHGAETESLVPFRDAERRIRRRPGARVTIPSCWASHAGGGRMMQRRPRWDVDVSIAWAMRAAGR